MSSSRVRGWGALVALACGLYAAPAFAQSDAEVATRARLLGEAQRAHEAGDHARALEIAQAAGQISMTPSLRFFMGRELRDMHRYAAALGVAQTCIAEVGRDPSIPQRELLLSECMGLRREAEGMVGSVTVVPPTPVLEGLRVTIDGEAVRSALLGFPFVVTAGNVVIEATAPGQRPFHFETRVPAGSDVRVPVVLVADASPTVVPPVVVPPPPARRPSPARSYLGPAVLLAGGAALFVTGGVFWALGNTPAQTIVDFCSIAPGGAYRCPDEPLYRSASESLQRNDSTATAFWVVGGAALVGGGVWLALSLTSSSPQPARVEASVLPGGASLRLRF